MDHVDGSETRRAVACVALPVLLAAVGTAGCGASVAPHRIAIPVMPFPVYTLHGKAHGFRLTSVRKAKNQLEMQYSNGTITVPVSETAQIGTPSPPSQAQLDQVNLPDGSVINYYSVPAQQYGGLDEAILFLPGTKVYIFWSSSVYQGILDPFFTSLTRR